METSAGLKQAETQLSMTCDRISALKGKLEDLAFRAQRIAAAHKNHLQNPDTMYGYDLQHFRRDLRAFAQEITSLPVLLGSLERSARYDEKALKLAQAVMRLSARLAQSLRALHEMALLAHQHIRTADHKIEAWYISQEVDEMVMRAQGLPASANKIVIAVGTPPGGAAPATTT